MAKKTGTKKLDWMILPLVILIGVIIFSLMTGRFTDKLKHDKDSKEWVVDTICHEGKYYVIIGHSLENINLGFKFIDTIKPTYSQNDTITKF